MNKKWFHRLPDEAHEELEKRVLQNADLFDILGDMIQRDLDEVARIRRSKDAYEKPDFAAYMADCNGFERALLKVLNYLPSTKEDDNA